MVALTSLGLPILLSAVAVFIVSSIVHLFLPHHKSDFEGIPDEAAVAAELRKYNIRPGDYFMPFVHGMKEMQSVEYQQKLMEGPRIVMTVRPSGSDSMGKALAVWFVYCLVIGVFAAYVAGRALPPGADYLEVFRFVGVTAFAAYSLSLPQQSIWWSKKWSSTFKSMLDGLLYALVTAGVFGWLWPA
ncbi:MAG: hypothetical protein KDD65_14400 [Bacteroidetes bacterium]|nr:hypothetical protein [Bacteroidota bacterium]